ncbi:MAG: DUF4402 domain-containing protein [Bacteroidota bacterium]
MKLNKIIGINCFFQTNSKARLCSFIFLFLSILLIFSNKLNAQPHPPQRSITAYPTQELNFGSFVLVNNGASGGSVTVDYQGSRTSSGDVYCLNVSPPATPAIFNIKLCQGRNVIITATPSTVTLSGSSGTLLLTIGATNKGPLGSSFQVDTDCDFITQIRVGGTLTVGNSFANPAGNYSGSFSLTFNQQ